MGMLHRTIEKAESEAKDLTVRYRTRSAVVIKKEKVYGEEPGFEALTWMEIKEIHPRPKIVSYVRWNTELKEN
jgi:hypothetical protein